MINRVESPSLYQINTSVGFWIKNLVFLFCICISSFLYGQESKGVLRQSRKQLLKNIELTNDLLDSNSSKHTLEQYLTIEVQLKSRGALINTLKKELVIAEDSILVLEEQIAVFQKDLERLKLEYANLIRAEYHNKITSSSLHILLSATDLNDAFQRIKYLKQYEEYRKNQLYLIQRQTEKLEEAKRKRERNVLETRLLFAASSKQTQLMLKGKESLTGVYNDLINREGELLQSLEIKKHENYQLRTELNQTIASDVSSVKNYKELSSSDFSANKGNLVWPVKEGFVSQSFGTQKHPTIKNIVIHNNGINIRTRKNEHVKAIFNGRVAAITKVPGYGRTVIIKHLSYYTVYSKLSSVFVNKGAVVNANEEIGIVKSKNGVSELHFEIWHKKQRKDPIKWITKRN